MLWFSHSSSSSAHPQVLFVSRAIFHVTGHVCGPEDEFDSDFILGQIRSVIKEQEQEQEARISDMKHARALSHAAYAPNIPTQYTTPAGFCAQHHIQPPVVDDDEDSGSEADLFCPSSLSSFAYEPAAEGHRQAPLLESPFFGCAASANRNSMPSASAVPEARCLCYPPRTPAICCQSCITLALLSAMLLSLLPTAHAWYTDYFFSRMLFVAPPHATSIESENVLELNQFLTKAKAKGVKEEEEEQEEARHPIELLVGLICARLVVTCRIRARLLLTCRLLLLRLILSQKMKMILRLPR